MTFLYILTGIILFFVVLLSFKLSLIIEMNESNKITLKYLFLKFVILDSSAPPKKKKEKKEKEKKSKDEPVAEEATDTTVTIKFAGDELEEWSK